MEDVVFYPSNHTYWAGAKRLPSVTEILKPLMGDLRFVREDILAHKSALGQAVHKAIELHLLDDLEYSSLSPAVARYFDQFLKFQRDTGFECWSAETVVAHPMGYAGMIDAVGTIKHKAPGPFDWKTTAALSPVVAIQTAAYAVAYNESHKEKISLKGTRYALRLAIDKYRLHEYSNCELGSDFQTFASLLNLHHWCERHNKTLELPA